ncbi:MAG: carboxypeptidase-like regulatory domain-containing protein [Bacteroidia bacterium]
MLCVISCKKEEYKVTVQGRVVNYKTGLPVEGVQVDVMAMSVSGGCVLIESIGTATTDQDGNYQIQAKHEEWLENDLRVEFYKDRFEYTSAETIIYFGTEQKDYSVNMRLKPQTGILFKVEDVKPFDYIRFFELKYQSDTAFYDVNFVPLTYLQDKAGKAEEFIETTGNKFTKIEYQYEQGSEKIAVKDSVFCPEFETTTYRIER